MNQENVHRMGRHLLKNKNDEKILIKMVQNKM